MLKQTLALSLLAALGSVACSDDDKPGPGGDRDDGGEETPRDRDSGMDARTTAPDSGQPRPDGSQTDDAGQPPMDSGNPDTGGPILTVCDASRAPTIPALRVEAVPGVGTLSRLVDAEQPKGSTDWYLVQQSGTVRILRNGALLDGNFVDVTSEITLGDNNDERGLLGIAFPPDYTTSGLFYIAMTATKGDYPNRDSVYEYQRSQDGLSATRTDKTIVQLSPSAGNHNGGNLQFGPDGFLYFGTGDGGGLCNNDEPGTPQNLSSPFGKILRFDPKAAQPHAALGNPYSGATGLNTVLHYGLRNPFRFGFDRATGDLYIGDVGQDSFEEVSFAASGSTGLNFGWPKFEGNTMNTCGGLSGQLRPGSTHTAPIVDIDVRNSASGPFADYISVIAGPVYRGQAIPQLQGVFLFGDYTGARLGALYQCEGETSDVTPIAKNKNPNAPNQAGLTRASGLPTFDQLTAIVEDNAGELYFVANRNTLWKLVPGG